MENVMNEVVNNVSENATEAIAEVAGEWTMKHTLVVGGLFVGGIVIGYVGTKLYHDYKTKKNAKAVPEKTEEPKQVEETTKKETLNVVKKPEDKQQ